MNPKTKEAIAEVLEDLDLRLKFNRDEALAKICAIVDKEREGEVVLFAFNGKGPQIIDGIFQGGIFSQQLHGQKGRLIFVPDQEAP